MMNIFPIFSQSTNPFINGYPNIKVGSAKLLMRQRGSLYVDSNFTLPIITSNDTLKNVYKNSGSIVFDTARQTPYIVSQNTDGSFKFNKVNISDVGVFSWNTGGNLFSSKDYNGAIPQNQYIGLVKENTGTPNLHIINGAKTRITLSYLDSFVGINNPSPQCALDVKGTIKGSNGIFRISEASMHTNPSDIRFKKDIQNISNASVFIQSLNPKTYFFKTDEFPSYGFSSKQSYGLIAQEVEKLFPEFVETNDKGYKSVNYIEFIPILLQFAKEKQIENEKQNQKIQSLETQLKELLMRIEKLEKTK